MGFSSYPMNVVDYRNYSMENDLNYCILPIDFHHYVYWD